MKIPMLRNLMDSTGSPQEEFSLPAIEEKVLAYWRANRVFEKSLALRQAQGKKYKRFVFFEGPPTANGRPGIHHVLARAFKDIVLRYKTMRGFYVPRKSGFDTHGLPVEIEVEKELGLKSKKEIEKFGIAEFNKKCKESTLKYKDEWERLTERMGFWLDLKNPYLTYENRYMETVWWILKEVWKKKLLYRGHKVVPWCPRCGTTLSSHELALGYEEVEDTSVYVKFYAPKLRAYILSWTTTPWTLPGNVALAVNPNVTYVKAKVGKELYILAKECLSVITEPHEIVDEMKGKELVGVAYEPLFDVSALKSKTSYKIYPASFVTTEDGTGVVHTAVMYGEDDYQLGMKVGLPARHTVDEAGKFMADVKGFAGLYVKAPETEKKILGHLEKKGLLFKTEKYSHEYPFCWRCQTPLLYYARDSWFIAMSKLRAKLLSENKKINWVPAHLREGRFGEWLREVKDWAISRSRYWGTPLPIWQCEKCEATEVLGGREEIGKRLGNHGNRYLLVRHGFAENNLKGIVSGWPERAMHHLTLEGRVEVERLAKRLLKENATVIYASDITRTKETAAILAKALRITKIQHDARLREVNTGEFSELHVADYRGFFTSEREQFTKRPEGGETLSDVRVRVWDFLREIDAKHRGKTILIVSHQYPIWMLEMTMRGWSEDESLAAKEEGGKDFVATGSAHEVPFRSLPRDTTGAADFHRPYVDEVTFSCTKCGAKMKRVPEVLDVWFDSGAMPFAQAHWPFAQTEKLTTNNQQLTYPADYISEGLDQTRGWFYTLLAIGILMGRGRSYKNVYVQGILLDKFGKKMSKSKGNAVDPWAMIQKYGIDAVRWFIYTGTRPGESIIFDEANVGKTLRQFI
ncbi:MAG: class I tRNA ligase family protein, partial [Candidatus Jorgensenbacteria bacterium]|nr:class I tRNA ligase family protein [Candidatus Jorgensenbacteria bacterium]